MNVSLNTIKEKALQNRVPIIQDDSLNYLVDVLLKTNSRSLLEVGTAIGYSALAINDKIPNIQITSLERDKLRHQEALENISALKKEDSIQLILTDALEYNTDKSYDAIFIDGAKAQNLSFFRLYFAYTNKVMIIDNTDYHGLVNSDERINNRRVRQMVERIRTFKEYLEMRNDLIIEILNIGDGMIVIQRK